MPIERRSIASLIPYRDNPRTHSQGQIDKLASLIHKYGFHDSHAAAIDEDGVVIWGHGRIEAARQAGLKEIPVEVLVGLSEADKQALRIADNAVGEQSGWDMELLAKELESLSQADYQLELLALDVDLLEGLGDVLDPGVLTEGGDWEGGLMGGALQGDEDEDDEGGVTTLKENPYTQKIATPVYEIKGDKPEVGALFNRDRTHALIADIKKADIPAEVQDFLIAAAHRHTIFQYDQIAEFYAHAEPEVQKLMEDSALVVIDFDRAIELGFVKLSKAIVDQYKKDYPDAK